MTTTKESIARLAFSNIGISKVVTSIDTPTTLEEKLIAAIFDATRDYVLTDFPWPFATEFIELGDVDGDTDDPVNTDWVFTYALPEGCMTLRRLVPADGRGADRKIPFRIGRNADVPVIFTDEEDAVAEMTVSITDVTLFDAHFIEALAWRLAYKLAPIVSKDKTLVQTALGMYEREKQLAAVSALNQGQADPPADSSFITSRN